MAQILLSDLVAALGPEILRVVHAAGRLDHPVGEPELLDLTDPAPPTPSGLLLGVGIGADDSRVASAVEAASTHRVAALVLKCRDRPVADVVELAERFGLTVLDAAPDLPWRRLEALCVSVLRGEPTLPTSGFTGVPTDDLFALANTVATLVGGAVAIMDTNQVIVAYSSLEGQRIDRTRSRGILGRRVPEDALPNHLADTVWNSRSVVRVQRSDDMDRLAVIVRAGSDVLGSLWVAIEDDVDAAECEAALVEAAKLAALHMLQMRHRAGAEQERRNEALRTMLESGTDTDTDTEFPGHLVALTEPADNDVTRRRVLGIQLLNLVVLDARSFGLSVAATLINDRLYVLVSTAGGGQHQSAIFLRHVVDRARNSLRRKVFGVVGGESAHPEALRGQRADVDAALDYLNRSGPPSGVVALDEIRAELVLHRVVRLVAEHPELRSGITERITEHDAVNGTQYAISLHTYLCSFGDITKASDCLHVHQNTMRHRLRRAAELFQIDLGRPEHLLQLWLELSAIYP